MHFFILRFITTAKTTLMPWSNFELDFLSLHPLNDLYSLLFQETMASRAKPKSKTQYLTVGAETTGRLDSRVNLKLSEGWKVNGPLIVVELLQGNISTRQWLWQVKFPLFMVI